MEAATVFPHLRKANSGPEPRSTFVLRVYATLTSQCVATFLLVWALRVAHFAGRLPMVTSGEDDLLALTGWGTFLYYFGVLGSFLCLSLLLRVRGVYPLNVGLLAAFTAAESAALSLALITLPDDLLLRAASTTVALFAGLAAYVLQNKGENFSWLGKWLFSLLWLLLFHTVVAGLFGWQQSDVLLYLGAALFSGLIVYDTWRLHNVYDTNEWVLASLDLYLDVLNLFMYIVRIVKRK